MKWGKQNCSFPFLSPLLSPSKTKITILHGEPINSFGFERFSLRRIDTTLGFIFCFTDDKERVSMWESISFTGWFWLGIKEFLLVSMVSNVFECLALSNSI